MIKNRAVIRPLCPSFFLSDEIAFENWFDALSQTADVNNRIFMGRDIAFSVYFVGVNTISSTHLAAAVPKNQYSQSLGIEVYAPCPVRIMWKIRVRHQFSNCDTKKEMTAYHDGRTASVIRIWCIHIEKGKSERPSIGCWRVECIALVCVSIYTDDTAHSRMNTVNYCGYAVSRVSYSNRTHRHRCVAVCLRRII